MFDQILFLDALKQRLNIKKDADLALVLKMEASRISRMRSDTRPINAKVLVRIHNNTGIPLKELEEMRSQPLAKTSAMSTDQVKAMSISAANTRNRYDYTFKINAVSMVSDSMSSRQVAKQLKLPESTMHNWIKAYRLGELDKRVTLNTKEIDYMQAMLKERATNLRKNAANPQSKEEKTLISALQKKLRSSTP